MSFDLKNAAGSAAAPSSGALVFGAASSSSTNPSVFTSTGSGAVALATSPTLVTPILGTPTSGTLTNCTGLPVGGISATGTASSGTYLNGAGQWVMPTLASYTVSTLPTAGTAGRMAFVTDADTPTYLGTLTGGGSVICPVFDNGTAWVSI